MPLSIPSEYMRPPLIAVGDSLYNGVRSLTVTNGYCQTSAPALVAQALGIRHRFVCPDPPRHILIDMPGWLTMLPDLDAIRAGLRENAAFWIAAPRSPSGRPLFDNVAIASTTIADLFTDTWRRADARVAELVATHGDRLGSFDGPLGDLFLAANTRFTLNPLGVDWLEDATQLDLAEAREPERLLVSIGSNNGLWEICFEGRAGARMALDGLPDLAERLARIADRGTTIYFNNLPPPSAVPNLMPLPDYAEYEPVGPGAYYPLYENRFGLNYGRISAEEMRALDRHIEEVNGIVRDALLTAFTRRERLRIVDMWSLMRKYDAKHLADSDDNGIRLKNRKRFSNVMLEADFWGAFRCGGLMSLDGMHPSGLGYGLLAQRVVDTMRADPDDPLAAAARDVDFEDCYAKEKLLRSMPGIWCLALWIWRDIRRARARGEPDPARSGHEEAATDAVMSAATRFKHAGPAARR